MSSPSIVNGLAIRILTIDHVALIQKTDLYPNLKNDGDSAFCLALSTFYFFKMEEAKHLIGGIRMIINELKLKTNQLAVLKNFYGELLGFSCKEIGDKQLMIPIGESKLIFEQTLAYGDPYYHVAINIPQNQFQEAKKWIKQYVSLQVEDGEDEVFFQELQAHSLYFLDPAGNIMEFIARHDLPNDRFAAFTAEACLGISEIGIPTEHINDTAVKLIRYDIPVRNNQEIIDNMLNFMGKDGVYLIVAPLGRRWIFSDLISKPFPLQVIVDDKFEIALDDNGRISIETVFEKS